MVSGLPGVEKSGARMWGSGPESTVVEAKAAGLLSGHCCVEGSPGLERNTE